MSRRSESVVTKNVTTFNTFWCDWWRYLNKSFHWIISGFNLRILFYFPIEYFFRSTNFKNFVIHYDQLRFILIKFKYSNFKVIQKIPNYKCLQSGNLIIKFFIFLCFFPCQFVKKIIYFKIEIVIIFTTKWIHKIPRLLVLNYLKSITNVYYEL